LRIFPALRTRDFHYHLPPELVAQHPLKERTQSRLLVLDRRQGTFRHRKFPALYEYLDEGDVLVVNNSKVIPARLRALKTPSGGNIEILLVEELTPNNWWVMLKPGRRVSHGTELVLLDRKKQRSPVSAVVEEKDEEGHYRLKFEGIPEIKDYWAEIGEVPLPPYIQREDEGPGLEDRERYQTVYAQPDGSVAAPTAGLHFDREILKRIRDKGVQTAEITLHVGLGTFAPVKADELDDHLMHEERFELSAKTAETLNEAKSKEKRVIAVGTTTLRVLETVAKDSGEIAPASGKTRLFVYPPYNFKIVDSLLTNFHLPESTLLMLVSAFASPGSTKGRELILNAYSEAVKERYRFFSYGDAMLIL
jgi:S-adenosylmethionine:tRNA ribosyltransferase-isomerase